MFYKFRKDLILILILILIFVFPGWEEEGGKGQRGEEVEAVS